MENDQLNPYYYAPEDKRMDDDQRAVWYLQSEEWVDQMMLEIRGLAYDANNDTWILPQGMTPLMNEFGAQRLKLLLRSLFHKDNRLTTKEGTSISQETKSIMKSIIWHMTRNHREYNFRMKDLNYLRITLEPSIRSILLNSKDGYIGRFLQTTRKEVVSQATQHGQYSETPVKKGFFNNLLSAGKRRAE